MLNHLHGKQSEPHAGSMAGWGKTYDTFVSLMTLGNERSLRQATLNLAGIRPADRILEVGCGTGSLTLAAKDQAGAESQVFGLDTAPDMLETARRKAKKAGLSVQFQQGQIEAIPYPDGQFDLVLSSLMLHHVHGIEAKQKGIAEVFRVLKPGGRFLIIDVEPPQNPHLLSLAGRILGHEALAYTLREYIPLLEQAGFQEIETGPTTSRFLSYLRGKRP